MNRDRSKAMDHVVLVLFENRSFDVLLGHLYGPAGVEIPPGLSDPDAHLSTEETLASLRGVLAPFFPRLAAGRMGGL